MKRILPILFYLPLLIYAQSQRQTVYSAVPNCYVQGFIPLQGGGHHRHVETEQPLVKPGFDHDFLHDCDDVRGVVRVALQPQVEFTGKAQVLFAIDPTDTKIRANQGHSTEVDLQLEPAEPPAELFHGTPERNLAAVLRDGLYKMARHHVHLSPDIATATFMLLLSVPYWAQSNPHDSGRGIRTGFSGITTIPEDIQTRQAFDVLIAKFPNPSEKNGLILNRLGSGLPMG